MGEPTDRTDRTEQTDRTHRTGRTHGTDRTGLGDRMKAYEIAARTVLPPHGYSVIRVDGRAFHTLLRSAPRPFDADFMAAMDATGVALCEEIQGAVFGYVQSDEVSVLVANLVPATSTDTGTRTDPQPWFGGEVQKQVSVAAATATAAFSMHYRTARRPATFDARVFPLPNPVEAANCFVWRQRDALRNSISMAAQAKFPAARLHGMSGDRMREMLLAEHGIDWAAYPDGAKRGRVVVRASAEREVTFVHTKTGVSETTKAWRSWWEAQAAPHFAAEADGWLAGMIPQMSEPGARA